MPARASKSPFSSIRARRALESDLAPDRGLPAAPAGGGGGAGLAFGEIVGVFDTFDPAWIAMGADDPYQPNPKAVLTDVEWGSIPRGSLAYTQSPPGWWVFNPYDVSSGGWPPPFEADPGPPFHGWKPLWNMAPRPAIYRQKNIAAGGGQFDILNDPPSFMQFGGQAQGWVYDEQDWGVGDWLDVSFQSSGGDQYMGGMLTAKHANGDLIRLQGAGVTSHWDDQSHAQMPVSFYGTQAQKDAVADTFEIFAQPMPGNTTANVLRIVTAGRVTIWGRLDFSSTDPQYA